MSGGTTTGAAATPAADVAASDAARRRQASLLSVVACPECGGHLVLRGAVRHGGLVVDADLDCAEHGRVGIVESHRVSFRPEDLVRSAAHRVPGGAVRLPVALDDERFSTEGEWVTGWEGARTDGDGAHTARLRFTGIGVSVTFYAHNWSGHASLRVDGQEVRVVDLFRGETALVLEDLVGLAPGDHELEVVRLGERHPASGGDQVIVNRFDVLVPPQDAPPPAPPVAVNRGNGYPPRFAELVAALPADAVAVDLGGGDRCLGDPRVFNLEYLRFELPDVFADGLRLPFRTGSLDLALSQAVLEHVPDPQQAMDEIRRVLRPGGVLYCEVAFMQPLHAVPSHYFNVTSFGLAHLLRDWDVVEAGTFTGLHDTFEWMGRCVSADQKVGPERLALALEVLAEIDALTDPEELRPIAGSVYSEAVRPADPPAPPPEPPPPYTAASLREDLARVARAGSRRAAGVARGLRGRRR